MEKFLKKYFNLLEIEKILKELEQKYRTNYTNDSYFVKVSKKDKDSQFTNLKLEIDLYKNNKDIFNFYIDSTITDEYLIIVLKKINGKSICRKRNNFNNTLNNQKRIQIINKIKEIKNLKITNSLTKYSIEELFIKYFERSKKYLSEKQITFLENNKALICEDTQYVVSHGDLIMPNIMLGEEIHFIDWEFIGYRSYTYDIAYFMLFAKGKNCLSYINKIDVSKKEVFKDAVIICLKEIQNWNKLRGKLDDSLIDLKVNRWLNELNLIIKEISKWKY